MLGKTAYTSYVAEQREEASAARRREIVDSLLEKLPETEHDRDINAAINIKQAGLAA